MLLISISNEDAILLRVKVSFSSQALNSAFGGKTIIGHYNTMSNSKKASGRLLKAIRCCNDSTFRSVNSDCLYYPQLVLLILIN